MQVSKVVGGQSSTSGVVEYASIQGGWWQSSTYSYETLSLSDFIVF